jgi:hypothetical protein
MPAHVQCAPAGDAREFSSAGIEFPAYGVGVAAVQERGSVLAQDAVDLGGFAGASAEPGVLALRVCGGLPQRVQVLAADAARSQVGGVWVCGDGELPGEGCGVGAESEGAGEEAASVHGAPVSGGIVDGGVGVAGEVQADVVGLPPGGGHADLGRVDGPA